MTRYEKIAISLPSRAAEHVRKAVRYGRAPSASAYIAGVIDKEAKAQSFDALLDEMLEESGGPMTAAEIRRVDRLLGLAPERKRKVRKRTLRSRTAGRR